MCSIVRRALLRHNFSMTRAPADRYNFPWGDADICPCGSTARFANCCKTARGQLPYIRIPNLLPPGKISNFAHPKCYMAATANCSRTISREHYISEAILERFDRLHVSGMPWQAKGEKRVFPANALAANILCERHNSALAPIDELGLRAFDAVVAGCDYALSGRHSGRIQHHLISGEGIELWLYKLLAGIHFGGIAAAECGLLRDTCSFPLEELVATLTVGKTPPKSSLWIASNVGLAERGQIAVGPLIDVARNRNIGVQVHFGPIQFEATLVAAPLSLTEEAMHAVRKRPRVVDIVGPARDARIVLTWPGVASDARRLEVKVAPE